jgi:hypothetical protein
MTYFADLTPYSYMGASPEPHVLNVGWLDPNHDFPKGHVDADILAELLDLVRSSPARQTRGYHVCPFCTQKTLGISINGTALSRRLGSAEIRVLGAGGRVYACPDLIYHYIVAHDYLPPEELLKALADTSAV